MNTGGSFPFPAPPDLFTGAEAAQAQPSGAPLKPSSQRKTRRGLGKAEILLTCWNP